MGLLILSAAGSVVFWLVLHFTLNRGPDRIQLATVCLAFALLGYVALAWQLHERGGSSLVVALAIALATVPYVAVGALAIYFARWAWRVCVAVLALHLLASLVGLFFASTMGPAAIVGAAQWLLLGAVALWACLHPGSRSSLLPPAGASAA
jgi:hypothetical protein